MRITKVLTKNAPIYNSEQHSVEIIDDGGGEFIEITEYAGKFQSIRINMDEWEGLKEAVEFLIEKSIEEPVDV
jgi:hypothetical protein